jgi:anti-anti-sigma factor
MPEIAKPGGLFHIERQGDTLIVTPQSDLRELEFERIEEAAREVLDRLDQKQARNIVLDFHLTDYYGTTALAFFTKLWKKTRTQQGRMALCHLSAHELDILHVTRLDSLWPVCASREEALRVVSEG